MSSVQSPMLSRTVSPSSRSVQSTPPVFRQTIVVCNRQGREEAFTIGPDGHVWCFFPDAADTEFADYSLASLGMPADHLTVARDAFGCLVVIAVKGLSVCYRVENETAEGARAVNPPARWSEVGYAPLPAITGAVSVRRVFTQNDCGLRVAAIIDVQDEPGHSAFTMAYCQWKVNGTNAFRTSLSASKRAL